MLEKLSMLIMDVYSMFFEKSNKKIQLISLRLVLIFIALGIPTFFADATGAEYSTLSVGKSIVTITIVNEEDMKESTTIFPEIGDKEPTALFPKTGDNSFKYGSVWTILIGLILFSSGLSRICSEQFKK